MTTIHYRLQRAGLAAAIALNLLAALVLAGCGTPAPPLDATPPETRPPAAETSTGSAYSPTVDVGAVMSSPDYGLQAFLYWQEEIADRDLKLIEDAGFRWVKQEFPWREIEGAGKGQWNWANTDRVMNQIDAHGLKVIARLGVQPGWAAGVPLPEIGPPDNLQDFYDYVFAVASRYQGRVEAYQIWNEPNLAREWGGRPPSPAEYTELLKTGYQAIKAADPNAIVISAGMAPTTRHDDQAMPDTLFIQGMYDAGAGPWFDVLGVHAPGYKSEPEIDPAVVAADPALNNNDSAPEELRRVYAFRRVEDLRRLMVANGDEAKKVVVLEFGWTIDPRPDSPYRWHAVTETQQDKYLQRAFAYAAENWQPWIGVMTVIYIADPRWTLEDEQTYWSVVYPGYPALRTSMAYYGLLTMGKVPPVE
ncbi:MAG: hypothetical protein Kow0031_27630 [Anaerolineae bacterium]